MVSIRAMTYEEARYIAKNYFKRRDFGLSCVFFVKNSSLRDWVFR